MISSILGADSTNSSATAVNFNYIDPTHTSGPWNATEANVDVPVPHNLVADQFLFSRKNAPTGTKSQTYSLVQNGSTSALTVTITGTSLSGSDLSNSVSYVSGDNISLRAAPTGTPAVDNPLWCIRQTATNLQALFGVNTNNVSTTSANFNGLQSAGAWNGGESNVYSVLPTGGVLKNLYVRISGAASGGTAHYTFALMRNGTAQALTTDISGAATAGTDTTNNFSAVAGDTVSIRCTPAGTPTARNVAWSCSFQPTSDGESVILYGDQSNPSTTLTQYEQPQGKASGVWSATETDRQMIVGSSTLTAFYVKLSAAPSGTASRTLTVRKNSSATALSITISGANTTGNISGQGISTADFDSLSVEDVPSGTPAPATVAWGILAFTAVPSANSPWRSLQGVGF